MCAYLMCLYRNGRNFQYAQVCPTSRYDGIDLIAGGEIATDQRGKTRAVAYPVAELCQEASTIGGFALRCCLACLYGDYITSMSFECLRNKNGILYLKTTIDAIRDGESYP